MARASSTLAILPARLGSTRLPSKMLADLGGQPLVVRTLARAREAFARVVVATDSPEIAEAVARAGGDFVLTGHAPNGTARVALAYAALEAQGGGADVVVNVQADEPLVHPGALVAIAEGLGDFDVATGAAPLDEPSNPARVKVVTGEDGRALYFSRSAVPHGGPFRVHLGVYAFRPAALARAVSLPEHPLEHSERLEQLRWLAHGMRVRVIDVPAGEGGVDTPEDLERVRAHFAAAAPGGG